MNAQLAQAASLAEVTSAALSRVSFKVLPNLGLDDVMQSVVSAKTGED